ncbi:hypothetical protein LAZ67_14003441, partial [Cordylochernes scorpioides]
MIFPLSMENRATKSDLRQRTGINTIPKNRTPVKSPDLVPMDFCIFGCLKRALGKRHPRTIEGLWKVVKEEWDLLSMTMIRKCLLSWKIRNLEIRFLRNRYPEEPALSAIIALIHLVIESNRDDMYRFPCSFNTTSQFIDSSDWSVVTAAIDQMFSIGDSSGERAGQDSSNPIFLY